MVFRAAVRHRHIEHGVGGRGCGRGRLVQRLRTLCGFRCERTALRVLSSSEETEDDADLLRAGVPDFLPRCSRLPRRNHGRIWGELKRS